MNKYKKYIVKDMSKLIVKLLAIVLIVILGIGFSLGLLTSAPNMRYSVEKYYNATNVADVIVQSYIPFNQHTLDEFKSNDLIDKIQGYYSYDEFIEYKNGKHLARINIFNFEEELEVNQLTLTEGRLPNSQSDTIEIVIERKQPFLIDIPLGYETSYMGKKVKVVGIVQNPWYFAFVEEISIQNSRPIEIIIYADQSLLNEVRYTHIATTFKNTIEYDKFSNKYEDLITSKVDILKLEYKNYFFTPIFQNQSFAKYKSDIKIVDAIALIFPLFFLLITILISMASITRIVEDQRQQLGTLRSLGYSKFMIMCKYILYSLISSGIGTIFGIGVGVYFIPLVVYNAYKNIYHLPTFSIKYYFSFTSIISFSMIISVVLVTIFSIASTLNERPTDLLKIKTQKPGNKIFIERITFIWKRLKFKYKSTFRNIFRHKKTLVLTLLGISGSTALLLAGFGVKDSVDLAGKYQFDEMINYDLEIDVNSSIKEVKEIEHYDFTYVAATNAQYLNKDYISVIVPKNNNIINDFIKFRTDRKLHFDMKDNSVIVTRQFASKHELKIGDVLNMKIQNKEFRFKITNIQEYYFGNNIYISEELFTNVNLNYNKIYVKTNIEDRSSLEKLENDLKANEDIVKVMFKEDLKYSFKNTSKSMDSLIIVLVVAASALSIIINYNLTLINVHTRKREIATLKVLGYQEVEVSGYVFRETSIISIVAIMVGLLFGKALHYLIISMIVIDGLLLNNQIWYPSYIYTTLLSLVFLGFVFFITLPETRRINMIDALKSFE